MKLSIVKPNPARNLFFFVQVFVGTTILVLAYLIYFYNPYFQSFISDAAKDVLQKLFFLLLILVWIDALAKYLFTLKLPVTKFSLMFVYVYNLVTYILHAVIKGKKSKIKRPTFDKATKTAFLSIVVKLFFLPIMLNTLTSNFPNFFNDLHNMQAGTLAVNFDNIFSMIVGLLFGIDTLIFAFGYTFEAGWLRSSIRSVEPTLFGWAIALITYPPVNSVTSQFLPMIQTGNTAFADNMVTLRIGQVILLCCYTLFVACSVSLGTKASNLTNRGIVSWGPYKYVRHPAYVAKLAGFFFEGVLFGGTLGYFLAWAGFATIYALRAYTEERHLNQDPDYIAYKKKVKWKAIPGIF